MSDLPKVEIFTTDAIECPHCGHVLLNPPTGPIECSFCTAPFEIVDDLEEGDK